MTRSVIREHIFKLLFRVEFHDAHELDGQIRLYMNGLGTISEADCKYIAYVLADCISVSSIFKLFRHR